LSPFFKVMPLSCMTSSCIAIENSLISIFIQFEQFW
jgi:hypothetical protein